MINLFIFLAFCLALLILGFDIGSFPLISPDEPRYAETAREMLERMDFITPYCNYEPRYDKPILFYWLELLSFKSFGLTEFAARLPSALAATGIVWLAFLLGSFHGFGIIASLIAVTTLQYFVFAKIAITDMVLCFLISASISFFYLGYFKRQNSKQRFAFKEKLSSRWLIASIAMMGFGMLCKGPVAVVLPLAVIVIFLISEKDLKDFVLNTWIELLIGLVLFLIITLPWYIMVHLQTDGIFTQQFFIGHNFKRFTAVHTGHSAPWWFYLPVTLIGFFPWSFFLPQAVLGADYSGKFNMRSDRAQNSKLNVFCIIWSLVTLAIFTCAQTKLPTYIMPIYLPLILLVANWWTDKFKATRSNSFKNLDALIGLGILFLSLCAGLYLGLVFFKRDLILIESSAFLLPIGSIGFIFCGAILIAMTAILYRARTAFVFLVVASILSYLIATKFILNPFAWHRDSGSKAFVKKLKPDDKLVTYRSHSTVYCFYAQKEIPKLSNKRFYEYLTENDKSNRYFITKPYYLKAFDKYSNSIQVEQTLSYGAQKTSSNGESLLPLPYEIIKQTPVLSYGKARDLNLLED